MERIAWKQRSDFLAFEKGLQLRKVIAALVINHLLRYRAVCSLCTTIWIKIFSRLQSKNFRSVKLKKIPRTKLICLKRQWTKKLSAKADILFDKFLSFPRIKISNSQTWMLGSAGTGVLLSDSAQHLRQKTQTFLTFTLLDAAGTSLTLFLN